MVRPDDKPDVFPPRGAPRLPGGGLPPSSEWAQPETLGPDWTWTPGRLLLGHDGQGRHFGRDDPRHIVTIAGSRAGKTRHVLVPNLLNYPGPCFVIDPKGELVRSTAEDRARFGPVHVLDPFGITGRASSVHNPFEELRRAPEANRAADAALFAEALVIEAGKDPHWTDSARNLIKGLTLYLLHKDPETASLGKLLNALADSPQGMGRVFYEMGESDAFDGVMANIGAAFASMLELDRDNAIVGFTKEMGSILSTARQQTAPLGDIKRVTDGPGSFALSDLGQGSITVYLVLPGMRLGTHARWLRLVLSQAFAAMELNPVPRGGLPVWFVLEEFPVLGYLRAVETAAGYIAGFGVRIWAVLQDLSQLKHHYQASWETFLGNAGVVQAFGNSDLTTTRYLSDMLGQARVVTRTSAPASAQQRAHGDDGTRRNEQSVPLLTPWEIALHFSARTRRHLILVPGERPTYVLREGDPDGMALRQS